MSSIFDSYHTVKEWEDAAEKDGRITFNAVYYVMGIVKIEQPDGKTAHRCVMWHSNGQCYVGKEHLPEFDINFDD